jgi:hypothetical protein
VDTPFSEILDPSQHSAGYCSNLELLITDQTHSSHGKVKITGYQSQYFYALGKNGSVDMPELESGE